MLLSSLARAIHADARQVVDARDDGADVDDAAAVRHMRGRGLRDKQRAEGVEGKGLLDLLRCHVDEEFALAGAGTGIVDCGWLGSRVL